MILVTTGGGALLAEFIDSILIFIFNIEEENEMQRPVIVAMAAAAIVLAGPGCARDLARASSGVIGCAPEDIAIDDVSVGWSETSWAASCGGTTFRCAGERSPWCAPETTPSRAEGEASAETPASDAARGETNDPKHSEDKADGATAQPSNEGDDASEGEPEPPPSPSTLPPGHPAPTLEGFTDAPH